MHKKKLLREILSEKVNVLPTDYTAEGVKEFPTEAMRQHNNYHNSIFAPLVKNHEYDPKDEYDSPHYFDSEKQNVKQREEFYIKHGLKRMTIDDVEENPEQMVHYLKVMQHHFPDHFSHFKHVPMNKEVNDFMSQNYDHHSSKVN